MPIIGIIPKNLVTQALNYYNQNSKEFKHIKNIKCIISNLKALEKGSKLKRVRKKSFLFAKVKNFLNTRKNSKGRKVKNNKI